MLKVTSKDGNTIFSTGDGVSILRERTNGKWTETQTADRVPEVVKGIPVTGKNEKRTANAGDAKDDDE